MACHLTPRKFFNCPACITKGPVAPVIGEGAAPLSCEYAAIVVFLCGRVVQGPLASKE